MTPSPEKITEALLIIGNHLTDMEAFMLTTAQSQATLFKLMNDRVTNLKPGEIENLRSAASLCESSLERQEHLASQFRDEFVRLLGT